MEAVCFECGKKFVYDLDEFGDDRDICFECEEEHNRNCLATMILSREVSFPWRKTMNWQPIETAPKDGSEVLLAVKIRAGIPGKMLVGHWMPGGHCIEDHPPIDAGWYFWNGSMFNLASKPTHWMPLPKLPGEEP